MKKIFLFVIPMMILFSLTENVYSSVYVNYTISGRIIRVQRDSIVTSAQTIYDVAAGTNVSSSRSVQYFDKVLPASMNSCTIKIFKKDSSAGNLVKTFSNLTPAQVNFVADSGKFSFSITDADQLSKSRFNYLALVYVDGASVSSYKEEFSTNDVSGAPPIGSIMPYFGDGSDMTTLEMGGWYLCDGRAINTTTMNQLEQTEVNALKAILSNSGNPSPNNLPDLRGYFLRGADRGTGNDPSAASRGGSGNKVGSTQNADVGVHSHTGSTSGAGGHDHNYTDYFFAEHNGGGSSQGSSSTDYDNNPTSNRTGTTTWVGDHTHTVTINNSTGTETRPKNVYVNYIIKCRN